VPVQYIPHPIQAVYNNVTGARALDPTPASYINVYQNTTLRPILVIVSCQCAWFAPANESRYIAYIGAGALPADPAGYSGYWRLPGTQPDYAHFSLTFTVGAGLYYRVAEDAPGANFVILNTWIEVNL